MSRLIDLTGQRFGRLSVIERSQRNRKAGHAMWVCLCDCGQLCEVDGYRLRHGLTKSCGCLMLEWLHTPHRTHGQSDSRLYSIWRSMKGRCNCPTNKAHVDYGGRGICVCPEWDKAFEAFAAWALASGYRDDLTIDRIDVNAGYSPENCRWATAKEQGRNKRYNRKLHYLGEEKTLGEWAEETGVPVNLISSRFERGWSAERIFNEPVHEECRNHRK